MRFVVPEGFSEASEGGGTRFYEIDGSSGAAGTFVVSTVGDVRAAELPADLAAHIRETRNDLVVSDVRATEVGGRAAQAFTLTQKPGTAASDLWCARAGSCCKLLEDKPMGLTRRRRRRRSCREHRPTGPPPRRPRPPRPEMPGVSNSSASCRGSRTPWTPSVVSTKRSPVVTARTDRSGAEGDPCPRARLSRARSGSSRASSSVSRPSSISDWTTVWSRVSRCRLPSRTAYARESPTWATRARSPTRSSAVRVVPPVPRRLRTGPRPHRQRDPRLHPRQPADPAPASRCRGTRGCRARSQPRRGRDRPRRRRRTAAAR